MFHLEIYQHRQGSCFRIAPRHLVTERPGLDEIMLVCISSTHMEVEKELPISFEIQISLANSNEACLPGIIRVRSIDSTCLAIAYSPDTPVLKSNSANSQWLPEPPKTHFSSSQYRVKYPQQNILDWRKSLGHPQGSNLEQKSSLAKELGVGYKAPGQIQHLIV